MIESHLIFQKYVPIFIHSIEAKRYLKMSRSYFWRIFYVSKFNLLYLLTQSCIFTVYSSFCPVPGYNTYISPMTRILLQLLSDLLKTYRFNDTFYLSKKNPRYLPLFSPICVCPKMISFQVSRLLVKFNHSCSPPFYFYKKTS